MTKSAAVLNAVRMHPRQLCINEICTNWCIAQDAFANQPSITTCIVLLFSALLFSVLRCSAASLAVGLVSPANVANLQTSASITDAPPNSIAEIYIASIENEAAAGAPCSPPKADIEHHKVTIREMRHILQIKEPGQTGRHIQGCRDQQKEEMSPRDAVPTFRVGVEGNVSARQLWQHQVEGDPQPAERLHQLLDQEMEAVPACLRMDASSSMISVQSRCH